MLCFLCVVVFCCVVVRYVLFCYGLLDVDLVCYVLLRVVMFCCGLLCFLLCALLFIGMLL